MKLVKRNQGYTTPVNSLLNEFFSDGFMNWPHGTIDKSWKRSPSVNIRDEKDAFELEFSVPGYSKEDFKVELDQNQLTVSGKLQKKEEDTKKNYTRREFSHSEFQRSFILPEDVVSEDELSAKYENGILNISIPKKEEKKPKAARMIEIS